MIGAGYERLTQANSAAIEEIRDSIVRIESRLSRIEGGLVLSGFLVGIGAALATKLIH